MDFGLMRTEKHFLQKVKTKNLMVCGGFFYLITKDAIYMYCKTFGGIIQSSKLQ